MEYSSTFSISTFDDGDRVYGGNVGDKVEGANRDVGLCVGCFVGRDVGGNVVLH